MSDVGALQRRVRALRRIGFGFAVDDAGAGYASFALIAALRPTVIKIDRDVVHGISRNDAKQALVEAFVSFGRRIGAHLLAEGIERRADLAALTELGVELGQGYLLGRPAPEPLPPRRVDVLEGGLTTSRARAARATGTSEARPRRRGTPRSRTIEGMTSPFPDRVRDFLDDLRFATIATLDPDGAPRQATVWYRLDGDEIVINSAEGRRWPANLMRDPRIALTVNDGEDGYRWVGLTGTVRATTDQSTAQADIAEMARRYHADDPDKAERLIRDRFTRQQRVSFRFRPAAVHDELEE